MRSPERRLLLTLLGLAIVGHAARLWFLAPSAPGGPPALGASGDLITHRAASEAVGRPLAPGERLDPNLASAADLDRLPGIGMRLAKDIVADRELRGFFGSAQDLDRVSGIGPATVRRLEPFLRFGHRMGTGPRLVNINTATQADLESLPGIGPARAKAILAYRDRHGPFADRLDLGKVPGIGRKLAERLAAEVRLR